MNYNKDTRMSNQEIKYFEIKDKDLYIFKKNSYRKIKTLGEGSFGKVLLVEKINPLDQNDSNYFAIKISRRFERVSNKENLDIPKNQKPKEINFIELREITIMKKIKHPNVVNLIEYCFPKKDREIWILMEYIKTDLRKFLYVNRENKNVMQEKFFKKICYQILKGVNYLHESNIMHRDLKLENILYDEEKEICKISDFGLSRQFDYDENTQYTDVGTFPYKPPEVILGLSHYSTAFDIWSLGCIFIEMCTGLKIFGEDNSLGVIKLIYKIFGTFNETILPGFKNFPFSKMLENIPLTEGIGLANYIISNQRFKFENSDFYDLIQKMLTIEHNKRINARDCLNHPWFSNLN